MIDHVIVTVSDLDRRKAFDERALAPLRMTATPEFPWGPTEARGVGFGGEDKEFFVVEGSPTQPPIHLAFGAATRAEVRAFHSEALAAGGRDNGAPAPTQELNREFRSPLGDLTLSVLQFTSALSELRLRVNELGT